MVVKLKPGLTALREAMQGLFREEGPEVVDLSRRKFLTGDALRPAPEAQLPAKLEVDPELLQRATAGEGRAVTTLAQAAELPVPKSQDELTQLVSRFTMPTRRGFLGQMGSAASHLIMPSPLKLLQSTAEGIGKLKVELSPLELMKYSQKYIDAPIERFITPDSLAELRDMEGIDPGEPVNIQMRHALKGLGYYGQSNDEHFKALLKGMDLEPTPQNMDSFEHLAEAGETFHPDMVDAHFDDIKHVAQDYAAGDWQTADDYLEEKAKELGVPIEDLEKQLAEYLDNVHSPNEQNYSAVNPEVAGSHIAARRNLDETADEYATDRGYMDNAYQDRLIGVERQPFEYAIEDIDEGAGLTLDEWRTSLDNGDEESDKPLLDVLNKYKDKLTGKILGNDLIELLKKELLPGQLKTELQERHMQGDDAFFSSDDIGYDD